MTQRYNQRFLWTTCLVACMGGLLFGYDWVVIGGAKPFFVRYFELANNPDLVGWGMSCALVGCTGVAVLSGLLSDKLGRKRLLILAALLFHSVLTLWITCWALAQFFPRIRLGFGDAGCFWMFSAICLAGFLFV